MEPRGTCYWKSNTTFASNASNMRTNIKYILLGYMWYDVHVESLLNIKGSSKNLAAMGMTEKNNFIREFSRYLHKT